MMLALLIALCALAALLLARVARRAHPAAGALSLLGACLLPLAAFLLMQLQAPPARTTEQLQLSGQFHALTQPVTIGSAPAADFVIEEAKLGGLEVVARYDAAANLLALEASAVEPVIVGDVPVNAAPLRRRSVLTAGDGQRVEILRPWWCWYRCTTWRVRREVSGSVLEWEVSADTSAMVRAAADTAVIFRLAGRDWISARAGRGLALDGAALPARANVAAGMLRVGAPPRDVAELSLNVPQQRLDIRFAGEARSRRTSLDAGTRFAVTTHPELQAWGTTPLVDPVALGGGAGVPAYGGILEKHAEGWTWSTGGVTRAVEIGAEQLLPGGAARAGHIVALTQPDTDPARARTAVVLLWLLGALLLAFTWRELHPVARSWRVAVAGLVFTLVFVRATLAFRTWLAPPQKPETLVTLLGLLIALPAMAAVLHAWERHSEPGRAGRRLLPNAVAIGAHLAVSLVIASLLVVPDWRLPVLRAALAPLLIGLPALALLARALVPPRAGVALPGPLAMLEPHARISTLRQFARAVAVLVLLGLLIPFVSRLAGAGKLMAMLGVLAVAAVALLLGAAPGHRIRPRSAQRRATYAVLLGALTAFVGLALRQPLLGAGAGVAAAAAGWWWFGQSRRRIRPVHAEDVLDPALLVGVMAGALLLITLGAVRTVAVVGEYALAIAGLLVFVRIFSVLWYRILANASPGPPRAAERRPLPGLRTVLLVLGAAAVVFLPLGVADPGLLMLFLAAAVIAAVVGLSILGTRGLVAGVAVAALFAVTVFGGMHVRSSTLRAGGASLSTPEVRYAAVYDPDGLQDHLLRARGYAQFRAINTLHQSWAMRSYAALGQATGKGYFQVDFTSRGSTWPVALTDNAFSVFVLSEHGWLGGAAIILLYLALGLVLLNAAMHSRDQRARVPRGILLTGVAAFWVLPTVYLAAANGLLVPLTGQNIPMLGLLSQADVALCSWLAALALIALPVATSAGEEHLPPRVTQGVRWSVRGIAATFAAAAVAVIALLWQPTHATGGDFVLDRVVERARELVALGSIRPDVVADGPDTLAVASVARHVPELQPGAFLAQAVRGSNRIARGEAPGAQCHQADALFRVTTAGGVAVFPSLCRVQAITTVSAPWRGRLLGRQGSTRYFVMAGARGVVLDGTAEDSVASVGAECGRQGVVFARAARLGCDDTAAVVSAGHNAVLLHPSAKGLTVNGEAASAPVVLTAGDHIRAGGLDVLSDSVPHGAIGYARWVNGRWRRFVERTTSPLLAQVDSQFARGLASPAESERDVALTIDQPLHHALQRIVRDCGGVPGGARCSILLADPNTGAILAFAQWPVRTTYPRDLPADANLRNHPAASAVKPLVAAAALRAYPSLAQLSVDHAQSEYRAIANVELGTEFRAARLFPRPRVPFAGYLPASDNLYSATLGFLAAAQRGDGDLPARRGTRDLSAVMVGNRRLTGTPAWRQNREGMDVGESPLARALEELYAVHVRGEDAPVVDARMWRSAVDADALPGGAELQRISPEPVALALDEIRTPRQLATFMIGGGSNRWNNVAMVEAISRIVTGREVQLQLVDRIDTTNVRQAPEPLAAMAPVRAPILAGMRGVIAEPWGTGAALAGEFGSHVNWFAKTGTLKEREWTGSIFLFAGMPAEARPGACAIAGIVTLELAPRANPDGAATRVFKERVAAVLRQHAGWGRAPCALE